MQTVKNAKSDELIKELEIYLAIPKGYDFFYDSWVGKKVYLLKLEQRYPPEINRSFSKLV